MFDCGLLPGEIIGNRRLMDIFHCACEGGIRYSTKTDTVVIVVNNTKNGLPNLWQNGILEFAGRPFKQQDIMQGGNRRLEQFLSANGDVFLFVVNKPGEYEYKGSVRAAAPYRIEENSDKVRYPVFPLLLNTHPLTDIPAG